MIYFVRAEATPYVKIGYVKTAKTKVSTSRAINKRISELQVGCPYELTLLRTADGELAEETALHNKYSTRKVRGEWFCLSDSEVMYEQVGDTSVTVKRTRAARAGVNAFLSQMTAYDIIGLVARVYGVRYHGDAYIISLEQDEYIYKAICAAHRAATAAYEDDQVSCAGNCGRLVSTVVPPGT